ncbi:MAG: hypothetical protein ACOC44_04295 [Promethearchaeia archaeon]
MERRRKRAKEAKEQEKEQEEVQDKEKQAYLKELKHLKELKKQKLIEQEKSRIKKELEEQQVKTGSSKPVKQETEASVESFASDLDKKLEEIEVDFQENLKESQLKQLLKQQEFLKSQLLKEKIANPYEKLLEEHPWLEERRYEFMYFIPDEEKDMESWKNEWSQILFDYAKFTVIHILYLKEISAEKPFSKFKKRIKALTLIGEKLIEQDLAKWVGKKKKLKLRVYWRDLEAWADEIYSWCIENGKIEPVMLYEIREANTHFSNLPREDLRKVYSILSKQNRGKIVELENEKLALKIIP